MAIRAEQESHQQVGKRPKAVSRPRTGWMNLVAGPRRLETTTVPNQMDSTPVDFIMSAAHGELISGSPNSRVSRVCSDSRQVVPGDLFVALAGDKFDGHAFVAQAVARGATAVIAERGPAVGGGDCALILVENSRAALGRLAAAYRGRFSVPMIAVCGSNGKTTTKELIAAVLRQRGLALWSEASFNNDIGVPLTLLRMSTAHSAAVLEAGTNHPGELAPLLAMIRPNYGVITSIGREHLEFFGNMQGVATEESTLAAMLPAAGKLFMNGDSEWAEFVASRSSAPVVRVGTGSHNDWRAVNIRTGFAGVTFSVEGPHELFCREYKVPLLGAHQAVNSLFAIALGDELGLSPSQVQAGLAECHAPKMRMQCWTAGEITVLDDAYNANADSMRAALVALRDLPCRGRRLAVLGDMAELGEYSPAAHEEVGRFAAQCGISQLITVGKMSGVTARAARQAGLNRVLEFLEVEAAAAAIKGFVKPGDLLLLKASRAMRLERIAETLRGNQ